MRKPRYALFDTFTRRYLLKAVQPAGDPAQLHTVWTSRPERALRFPGMKSARRMAGRLGGEIQIVNQRGEIIP